MKLSLTFKKGPGTKPQVVEVYTSDNLTMADMKRLWEFEQFMNVLPGCPLRLHVGLTEGPEAKDDPRP